MVKEYKLSSTFQVEPKLQNGGGVYEIENKPLEKFIHFLHQSYI